MIELKKSHLSLEGRISKIDLPKISNEKNEINNDNNIYSLLKIEDSLDFNSFCVEEKKHKIIPEDTQISFLSHSSLDINLQNSFIKHFGSSKFHEKFFKINKKEKNKKK